MSDILASQRREEAIYLLHKAAIEGGDKLLGSHQWVWEVTRWKELAFAILAQIADVPEKELRRLTNHMEALGLLNISALAKLAKECESTEIQHQIHGRRVVELFQGAGFSEEQALKGLITISEAALVLQEQYEGKVQKYLRYYGELMLKDLDHIFSFSALDKTEAANAFTYWLQNVLNMPLSLIDENVQNFCRVHNLQPEDLIAAADDVGLNLGFMDDLVYLYNVKHTKAADNKEEQNP